jgi:diadenosine tetraphosphatase ApaH/serine/threonine PP2A family protein phosphatase
MPSEDNPYVFNGDFVDRGSFSVEVVLTLLAFKASCAPLAMTLIRGNHESQMMNLMYGFHAEAVAKYGDALALRFRRLFCHLPLAACLNDKVLVMHGGLFSHDDVSLADIAAVERVREPPDDGLMAELLWSDPMPAPGRAPNVRGMGVSFGPDVTRAFLAKNGLSLLVRSHEVKNEGASLQRWKSCESWYSLRFGTARQKLALLNTRHKVGSPVGGSVDELAPEMTMDRVRGAPRRATHHHLLRAQLLRPYGQQGGAHPLRRRHDPALHVLRSRSPPGRALLRAPGNLLLARQR